MRLRLLRGCVVSGAECRVRRGLGTGRVAHVGRQLLRLTSGNAGARAVVGERSSAVWKSNSGAACQSAVSTWPTEGGEDALAGGSLACNADADAGVAD